MASLVADYGESGTDSSSEDSESENVMKKYDLLLKIRII